MVPEHLDPFRVVRLVRLNPVRLLDSLWVLVVPRPVGYPLVALVVVLPVRLPDLEVEGLRPSSQP